jgi:hypothetical protein
MVGEKLTYLAEAISLMPVSFHGTKEREIMPRTLQIAAPSRAWVSSCALVVTCSASALAQSKTGAEQAATSLSTAISTAAIAALVGGVGWIAAYVLNGFRDDRTKRLQLTIEHTSAQIREFYAPLVALTDQLATTGSVRAAVKGKNPDEEHALSGLIYKEFFLPIHEQINTILKTKIHLVEVMEGVLTPDSFDAYFRHYATEKAYWSLVEQGKDLSRMDVPDYPEKFYHDVRRGFGVVMRRNESCLQELRHRPFSSLRKEIAAQKRGFANLLGGALRALRPKRTE